MTHLICLIQAANLKDRRCIRFNEQFETDEVEAEILIRGGIAKAAPVKKEPVVVDPQMEPSDLYQKAQELKEESDDGMQQAEETAETKKVTPKKKGR
jgi:hypothetical protein